MAPNSPEYFFRERKLLSCTLCKVVILMKQESENTKWRSRALQVAVSVQGVNSASIEGRDCVSLVIIGDGVDVIRLACLLRKKVCYAELVSVGPWQRIDPMRRISRPRIREEENEGEAETEEISGCFKAVLCFTKWC